MAQVSTTLDRQIVSKLLETQRKGLSGDEEDLHPWKVDYLQSLFQEPFQEPLLKIWDESSGNERRDGIGMLSRAPDMRLDTAEVRKTTLLRHLNYRDWTLGPYISFTVSPEAIEALMLRRASRGSQTLTVVDPNTRVGNGLPVLDVAAEMDHYGIPDPYRKSKEYYINHYVCLWQVTEAEIVRHYPWNDLANNQNWYQEIIIPDFKQFRETASAKEKVSSNNNRIASNGSGTKSRPTIMAKCDTDNLSIHFNKLAVTHDPPEYSDPDIPDKPFNYVQNDQCSWDMDDEAEVANTADDILKIIEGDWN